MVLAILLLRRSPTRSLPAYMVAMLTMIWGFGAWAEVSSRLTSPRDIAVNPNQLARDITRDPGDNIEQNIST